jgi:hypothetical protein
VLNFENALTFKAGQEPDAALRNFWAPEGTWVWSTGRWSEINFAFDLGLRAPVGTAEIIMDVDVFKHEEKHPGQNVLIYLNGLRIGSLYCTHRVTVVFAFDARILTRADNVLTLDTPDATSPAAFGDPDGRSLGAQVFSIQIRKAI